MEDRRGKDNKMPRRVWKTVEANTGKIGMAETERGRSKRKNREKREEKAEKQKKQKKAKTIDVKRIAENWENWDEEE